MQTKTNIGPGPRQGARDPHRIADRSELDPGAPSDGMLFGACWTRRRVAARSAALAKRETTKSTRIARSQLLLRPPQTLSEAFERRLVGEADYERLTATEARAKALRWVDGVPVRSGDPHARRRRIEGCGRLMVAFNARTREFAWAATSCKDAACPKCQKMKSRQYARAISEFLEAGGDRRLRTRFITLSQLKDPGETVDAAMDRLMKSWNRLRNRKVWKRHVAGGVRTVEVTYRKAGTVNKDGSVVKATGWHVHLHALVELDAERVRDYAPTLERGIPQVLYRIRDAWLEVSPRSSAPAQVLDPEPLRGGGKAAWYVCKYISKGFDLPEEVARAFFSRMAGRRFMDGFGTWRGHWRAPLKEKAPREDGWTVQDLTLSELWEKATQNLKVTMRWRQVGPEYYSARHGQTLGGMVVEEDWSARKILYRLVSCSRSLWGARKGASGTQPFGRQKNDAGGNTGVKKSTLESGVDPP